MAKGLDCKSSIRRFDSGLQLQVSSQEVSVETLIALVVVFLVMVLSVIFGEHIEQFMSFLALLLIFPPMWCAQQVLAAWDWARSKRSAS